MRLIALSVLTMLATIETIRRWDAYLSVIGRDDKTRRDYRHALGWMMVDAHLDPLEATEDDVVGWIATLPVQGGKRGLVLRALHSFYKWAEPRGVCGNPTAKLPIPRVREKEAPSLSEEELTRLVIAAAWVEPRRAWAILLAYGSLARVGSLCAVTADDIRDGRVYFTEAKNDDPYSVVLSPTARIAAEELMALKDWMPKRVRSRRPTLIGVGEGQFWNWVERAGVDSGVRAWPHLLRDTGATHLSERGVDVTVIRRLLNHKDLRTTQKYVAVSDAREADAMARL